MNRVLRAMRFNEPQVRMTLALTALNVFAILPADDRPIWAWAVVLLMWPSIAFVGNLILDPLDADR